MLLLKVSAMITIVMSSARCEQPPGALFWRLREKRDTFPNGESVAHFPQLGKVALGKVQIGESVSHFPQLGKVMRKVFHHWGK
jgi:hypothetical protein